MSLTHFNQQGRAHMVGIEDKLETKREAIASGCVTMNALAFEQLLNKTASKGDVLAVADVAGIMGAKMTSQLIPMCHSIQLTGVNLRFELENASKTVRIFASAKTVGRTGVEMEALTAVSIAALTIYDMLKAVDKNMIITDVKLIEKLGGKSGHYKRGESLEG